MLQCFLPFFCTFILVGGAVIELTDLNAHAIQSGEWFIKAYKPSCPASQNIASSWIELAEWAIDKQYNIAEIDITAGHSLGSQFLVTKTPTIFHVKDGVFTQFQGIINSNQYRGKLETWKTFLLNKMSEQLVPLSWYRSPGSCTMIMFTYLNAHLKISPLASCSVIVSIFLVLLAAAVYLLSWFIKTRTQNPQDQKKFR